MSTRILYDLNPNKTYIIKVRARAGTVAGPWSGPLYVTTQAALSPSTPATPSATAGNTTATVSWTANAGNVVAYYEVYYHTSSTFSPPSGSPSGTLAGSTSGTSFTITGLTNGQNYWVKIIAVSKDGVNSQPSAVSNQVTPTSVSINLPKSQWHFMRTVVSVPGSTVTNMDMAGGSSYLYVSWSSINDPNGNVMYKVYIQDADTGWVYNATTFVGSTQDNFYTITRLPDGTRLRTGQVYFVRLKIATTDGNWESDATASVRGRLRAGAVAGVDALIRPNSVAAPTPVPMPAGDYISVSWTPYTDPYNEVRYNVYIETADSFAYDSTEFVGTTTGNNMVIKSYYNGSSWVPLVGNQLYWIRLKYEVDGYTSTQSAAAKTTLMNTRKSRVEAYLSGTIVPTPTVLAGPSSFALSWAPINDPQNVVMYEVFIKTTNSFAYNASEKVGETSGGQMVINKMPDGTPLLKNQEYYFTLRVKTGGTRDIATGTVVGPRRLLQGRNHAMDTWIGPSITPTFTLTPGPDFLVANWTPVYDPNKVVVYEIFIRAADSGWSYDSNDKAGEVVGSSFVIRGTPAGLLPTLSQNTTYYVRMRAKVGNATLAPSATVSSRTASSGKQYSSIHAVLATKTANIGTPVLIGGVGYLTAMWTPVNNPNGTVTYRVYMRTSDTNWTFDSTEKVGETQGTTLVIKATPDGSALERNTNYYVRVMPIAPGYDVPTTAAIAPTATNLTNGLDDTDATSYTATVSWTANKPIFAAIVTRKASLPSAPNSVKSSANTLVFEKVIDKFVDLSTDANMSLWMVKNPPAAVAGETTITWDMGTTTHLGSLWHFFQLNDADTTSPVEGTPVSNSQASGGTISTTLAAFANSYDRPFEFIFSPATSAQTAITPEYTTIGTENIATTPAGRSEIAIHSSQDTSPSATVYASSGSGIIAVKLRAAPAPADAAYASNTSNAASLATVSREDLNPNIITADYLDANIALVNNTLTVGDTSPTGRYVEIDSGGISLLNAGDQLVNIPTDPASNPYFKGKLVTSELTVEGGMNLQGTSNYLDKGSALNLSSQVQSPPAPTLSVNWEYIDLATAYDINRSGLCYCATGGVNQTVACWYSVGGQIINSQYTTTKILEIEDISGAVNVIYDAGYGEVTSVVRPASSDYIFYIQSAGGTYYSIKKLNRTTSRVELISTNINSPNGQPALGIDSGGNVIFWFVNNNGYVKGLQYNTSLVATGSDITSSNTISGGNASVQGAHWDGDLTTPYWWLILKTGGTGSYPDATVVRYTSTGTWGGANVEWKTTSNLKGITAKAIGGPEDTNFYTHRAGAQMIKHTTWTWSGNKSFWVAYNWRDGAGTPHITTVGSTSKITMNNYRYARIAITTATKPTGVTNYYIYALDATPGTLQYQAITTYVTSNTDTTTYMINYNGAGGAPIVPGAGGTAIFDAGTSEIKSDVTMGNIVIGGDGTLRVPQIATTSRPTGSEGQVVFDSTQNALYVHDGNHWNLVPMVGRTLQRVAALYEDFFYTQSATNGYNNFNVNAGGGAIADAAIGSSSSHVGVIGLNTSTSTTAHPRLLTGPSWVIGGTSPKFRAGAWVRLTGVSDITETYTAYFGLADVVSIDAASSATDSYILFRYKHSVASGHWQMLIGNASTGSNDNTSVAVAASTWYLLEIECDGTTARFYVDGTEYGALTTGLPTSKAMNLKFGIQKTAGSTARELQVDAVYATYEMGGSR